MFSFLSKKGFDVTNHENDKSILPAISKEGINFSLIYIGDPSTKLELRSHAYKIHKNFSDPNTGIAMLYNGDFLFISVQHFSRMLKVIINSARNNSSEISTIFSEILEDIKREYSSGRNTFGIKEFLKNIAAN